MDDKSHSSKVDSFRLSFFLACSLFILFGHPTSTTCHFTSWSLPGRLVHPAQSVWQPLDGSASEK
jgi:hypothetical protein